MATPTVLTRGDPASPPRHRRVATTLGGAVAVVGLALAFLTALGIDRLFAQRVGEGLALLALVVALRWASAEALDAWYSRLGARARQHWRGRVLAFFLVPRASASSPVQIADAIDTIVDEPRLAVVRASAQASILALVVVFVTGGWQALSLVVVLLAVAVPLYQRAGTRAAALDIEYRERRTRLGERQLELLTHAPELRGLGAVHYGAREIAALSASEHHVALRAIRTALGSSLVTEFLGGVSVGLVAMDVGFGLLNAHLSLLRALLCVLATSEFFSHVRRYGVEFHRREAIDAARERLVVPERLEVSTAEVLVSEAVVTLANPQPISLVLRRGDRVAVLGASGIGKTTLAHTWLGWRAAQAGQVRRTDEAIAYVSADTALIPGTLGENLRLGLDVADGVVLELLSALGLSSAHFDDVNFPVSADGEGFSSGERVRILIARALLHQPRLLILDDVAGLLDERARSAIADVLTHRD
ncbi:MAG: ATP-binding cassette domain-containing protein, partial [Actinomycetota bacterium]|nr:ATP-binding cassette domain-containing protein [Actinomycetota bacterium]